MAAVVAYCVIWLTLDERGAQLISLKVRLILFISFSELKLGVNRSISISLIIAINLCVP